MITVELTAAIDSLGTTQTFYFATSSFVSSTGDTPANTIFYDAIKEPGYLGVNIFADGYTGGASKVENGEIVLNNVSGKFDALINYGFDGRVVTIREGQLGAAYPSSFRTVLVGTIESFEYKLGTIVFKLKDKQTAFDKPVQTVKYLGNNALPAGIEGVANDIKDKFLPILYGAGYGIKPDCVNTSKLIYRITDAALQSVSAVYLDGATVTFGTDRANAAAMEATAPAAGNYDTCLAEGLIRLGAAPQATITVDALQGANAAARTVAQLLKLLAIRAGFSMGADSLTDITALDTKNSAVVGTYITGDDNYRKHMDALANSIGAYYGFDRYGVFRMGRLEVPTTTPVATIEDYRVLSGLEFTTPKDNGLPVYRGVATWRKQQTVLTTFAGSVSDANRALMGTQFRQVSSTDNAAVQTKHLNSKILQIETLLTTEADALTEASRQRDMRLVQRKILKVAVDVAFLTENDLNCGDEVALQISRYGLDNGPSFILIGINYALRGSRVILSLWG
jgi:hypothetical protein